MAIGRTCAVLGALWILGLVFVTDSSRDVYLTAQSVAMRNYSDYEDDSSVSVDVHRPRQRGLLNWTSSSDAELNSSYQGPRIYPEGAVWDAALIQRVVTLSIIMLVTLVGNSLIVTVLSRSRYRKRSSRVNIFILNLAVGDLAVCAITMTSELLFEVFGEWVLGYVACKAIVYAQIVTLASTTFILTSMTYDRYEAICRPLHSTFAGGVKRAKRMIATSWILAFVFALPQIFIFVQVEKGVTTTGRVRYECLSQGYTHQWQRKLYFTWLTCYILVIPFCCIFFCYASLLRAVWKAARTPARQTENSGDSCSKKTSGSSQQSVVSGKAPKDTAVMLRRSFNAASNISRAKIKTLKFTICIILSFVVCWTPYFVVHNIRIYSDYRVKISPNVIVCAETLALLNSALNPIFYGYFNVRLRKGFIEIVYRKRDLGSCVTANTSCSNGMGAPAPSTATTVRSAKSNDCLECLDGSYSSGSYHKDSLKHANKFISGTLELRPFRSKNSCRGVRNAAAARGKGFDDLKCDSV